MSENVELVCTLTDAANRIDLDAVLALLAPDVVWEENAELPGLKEVYRGRAEVRGWAEQVLEVFEGPHQELDRITELSGDRVFTENVITAHGKGSGAPTELRYWAVCWINEGKIARRQVFWNRDEALEADGRRNSRYGRKAVARTAALHGKQHSTAPRAREGGDR